MTPIYSSHTPYTHAQTGYSVERLTAAVISVALIALGISLYLGGPYIMPQIFQTSTQQISALVFFAGSGVIIDLVLLVQVCLSCCAKKPVTQLPPRLPPEPIPRNPKVVYGTANDGHFILALGNQAFARLEAGYPTVQPAVVVKRSEEGIQIKAHNGFLFQRRDNPRHFTFIDPSYACASGREEWFLNWEDSLEDPVMVFFDDKFINTWPMLERDCLPDTPERVSNQSASAGGRDRA